MIDVDMSSIDIGPAYLGAGKMAPTSIGAKRDLRKVLRAARWLDIPLIVGSAGSAGARPHLDQTLEIIREIAREDGLAFRLGVVASDLPREDVRQAITAGRVRPMDTMPPRRGLPFQRIPPHGRRRYGAPVPGRAGDGGSVMATHDTAV
jgi:hypothetical protein